MFLMRINVYSFNTVAGRERQSMLCTVTCGLLSDCVASGTSDLISFCSRHRCSVLVAHAAMVKPAQVCMPCFGQIILDSRGRIVSDHLGGITFRCGCVTIFRDGLLVDRTRFLVGSESSLSRSGLV